MGPIQLVVFDLAGTTIEDKGNVVLQCLVEAARAYELPGTPEELNALMGMNKREVFGMLARQIYPADQERADYLAAEALAGFVTRMRSSYENHLAAVPGAEETFRYLRARGIKIATDTGFDATIGSLIMERLDWPGRLIDLAVFSSDVRRGRPAPYMIFRAMEQLEVLDVRQVMKIGDSPADLEEGCNAGCAEVIGVLSGAHTAATLGAYRHTRLIESVADLPALFAEEH
ncbi:MAG TPA: HAD family hydrolase [Ktedonobacteraceae bacterium]|nr:HAD family hydrolase [Ktedonobacteraceae bacterium]